jgi:hypothetical protein
MKTLLAVLLLTGLATGEDAIHNGNFWRTFSSEMKTAYIVGYSDGRCDDALKVSAIEPPLSAQQLSHVTGCRGAGQVTYGQLLEAIDQFYQNPSNRLILIPSAYDYVTAEIEGRPLSQKELQTMRRVGASK